MFFYLSKLLPLFVYPLGLACVLLGLALLIQRNPRWQTRLIAITLALLWLGGNRIVAMAIVRSLEWRYAPPNGQPTRIPHGDVIVVLGGATRAPDYPRPMTELNEAGDRVIYAAQLYADGAAPYILVSGGNAPWVSPTDGPAEAEVIADLLNLMGVPDDAIWLETASRNTYENALYSFDLLAETDVETLILVTSAFHMPRAHAIFEKNGPYTIIPAPTDYRVTQAEWEHYTQLRLSIQLFNLMPSSRELSWTTQMLKEYMGLVVYRLRGWL